MSIELALARVAELQPAFARPAAQQAAVGYVRLG